MTYIFFAVEHYPYPLAYHIREEGGEAFVASIENKSALEIPGTEDKETPEEKKVRLSYYDGMLEKIPHTEVLEFLEGVKNKDDYFIFFDYNDLFAIVDKVLKMGFTHGLFPTVFYYRMEEERELAKEFAKKYMKYVKVAEYEKFLKVEDGINFINESKDFLVLKSNGKAGDTIVPTTKKIDIAKEQLTSILQKCKTQYEANGFILEKRIDNCLEVAPVMVFYNGRPIYSLVEFENKEFGAGNIGPLKGGNLVVSVKTDLNCKMNRIAFPPIIHKMAAKQPGIGVYDAGLLWTGEDFYFTEFCGQRYGFDGLYSEIAMGDQGEPFTTKYFQNLIDGIDPLANKFGLGVRLFNYEGHTHDSEKAKSDIPIRLEKPIPNNLFWYRVKMNGEGLVSIGGQDMLGVVAGGGDDLEKMARETYKMVEAIEFDKLYYRPLFDLLSTDYETSILNRMQAVARFM
jgi:phosphoribosylamine-glycine ligase